MHKLPYCFIGDKNNLLYSDGKDMILDFTKI